MKINFPAECFEDILRHLSGKYLLTCTLVCPEWNEFIGATKSCMQKLHVKLETKCFTSETNSKRKYRNISLHWESCTVDSVLKSLRNFQSSVQNLDLNFEGNKENITIKRSFADIQFP